MESPVTALIVEDEDDVKELLVLYAESEFDVVFSASNGLEALDILSKENIDVVVTDIKMPKMNGLDLLRKYREIDPDGICLFVTGVADTEIAIESIHLGVFDMLLKPFDKNIIFETFQKAIRKCEQNRVTSFVASQAVKAG